GNLGDAVDAAGAAGDDNGPDRQLSPTHDMSGSCDTRSVRFWNRSRQGGEDEANSGVARSTTDEVRADSEPLGRQGAEPGGGGGDLGCDGADVPALASTLR